MFALIWIIGGLAIGFIIWNGFKKHPENFKNDLMSGEYIVELIKGDYWKKLFWFIHVQEIGEIAFTNKRVIFKELAKIGHPQFILSSFSIPYKEMAYVEKCFTGPFLPFGIKIMTKQGKKYVISVLNRKKYIQLIESLGSQAVKEEVCQ